VTIASFLGAPPPRAHRFDLGRLTWTMNVA
jgi:hypothetical protein